MPAPFARSVLTFSTALMHENGALANGNQTNGHQHPDLAAFEDVDFSEAEMRDVVVIGTGPAGWTAALYTARADLSPLIFMGPEPGGQLTTTTDVENYPGFPEGLMGPEMMDRFQDQAERFGTESRYGTVTHVDFRERPFRLLIGGETPVYAQTAIISTGASARYLGLENEQRLIGKGVSACATCDGSFFRGETVAVVGGGDSAMEESTFLTKFAEKVYVLHRREELRASEIMQQRAFENDKIEFVWNTEVIDVLGESAVEGIEVINNETGETRVMGDVTGFFLAIGHTPNTGPFEGWVQMDETGYIQTEGASTYTDVPGVFACGDAQDSTYRQAVTAAGTGCKAAIDAERWLSEHGAAEAPRADANRQPVEA
ncbi:thioredoxin-disulfide reductase [Salinibacter ruber]|uniref:thioredoxin-disulfide reductase n=1 Tax=Salinibacter ruber TaxID=146919 RepID=UPI0023431A4D